MLPTVRPPASTTIWADVFVSPTTLGTATDAGPEETPRVTVEFLATVVPATGVWLITSPTGTMSLATVVIRPRLRSLAWIVASAIVCDEPTTFGMITRTGPEETSKLIAEPWPAD